jgi:hypothetical protein
VGPSDSLQTLATRPSKSWPPAITKFVGATGAGNPIAAAQRSAAQLLDEYYRKSARGLPISVRTLCGLLGIQLRGRAPKTIARRLTDSLGLTLGAASRRNVSTLFVGSDGAVIDVTDPNPASARVSIAHEIGHYLIHFREGRIDGQTLALPTSPEEESLSEYLGRLLLLPWDDIRDQVTHANSWALACLELAGKGAVSVHAVANRLNDPDQDVRPMQGAIYWKRNPKISKDAPIERQLSPYWHTCPHTYIPIRKCHVLHDSVIARVAAADGDAKDVGEELVDIGTLKGRFLVDCFAWGSANSGTRTALSLFFGSSQK